MSVVVPWQQLNPADSPYVKMFGLVGISFAAGIINFVVLTAAALLVIVVYLLIAVRCLD